MKILYLHNTPIGSKSANLIQVKSMCNAFIKNGCEVVLSLPKSNQISNNDFKYCVDYRDSLFQSKTFSKYLNSTAIKKQTNEFQPDIIYLRSPSLLHAALRTNSSIIVELHKDKLHSRFNLIDRYWEKLLVKGLKENQIKKVVCISEALSKIWIKKGIPDDSIITEHDAINPKNFKNYKSNYKEGLNKNSTTIAYVGSLYKNRKIENIIILAEKFPKHNFLVIGGPNERANYFSRIVNDNQVQNIQFLGPVPHDKVSQYLFQSDILLALWSSKVPTMDYCSPLKIFEYMAAGKIIVAHGFPPIKEVLKDGYNAILSNPDDIDDLITKTDYAIQLHKSGTNIDKQAREDVLNNYTWEGRVKRILSHVGY